MRGLQLPLVVLLSTLLAGCLCSSVLDLGAPGTDPSGDGSADADGRDSDARVDARDSDARADGATSDAGDAGADAVDDAMADGAADGMADGAADGMADGAADAMADGPADAMADGPADAMADATADALPDGPCQCEDGLSCTLDSCDGNGCSSALQEGACLIDGSCIASGEASPLDPCEACDPAIDPSDWSLAVDDGIACTEDSCGGAGPIHDANDAACAPGEVCAPCAGTPDGCVEAPTISIDCGDPADTGRAQDCEIQLVDSGQAECLSCGAVVGMTSLVLERFDGCPDLTNNGWEVSGSRVCPEDVALFDFLGQDGAIDVVNNVFTMERVVNTSDYDRIRLCFDYADKGADANDTVQVSVDPGAGWSLVFSDDSGPLVPSSIDSIWTKQCLQLDVSDPASADNPFLGIRFVLTSLGGADHLFIDNVAIDAWNSGQVTPEESIFSYDFTGCGLGAFSVQEIQGTLGCPVVGAPHAGRDALQADGANVDGSITWYSSISETCDDVWLRFTHFASSGSGAEEVVSVLFDVGSGFAGAWSASDQIAASPLTTEIAVSLSHLDPSVRFHPNLGARFRLASVTTGYVFVDDIRMTGAVCGSGVGLLEVGSPEDQEDGRYAISLESISQMTAHVSCTWDGRTNTTGRDSLVFRDP